MYRLTLPVLIFVAMGLGVAAAPAPPAAIQTVQLDRLMRQKLAHSQKILEAVVVSNWDQLEQESRALQQVTREPAWRVLMTPEYVRHTGAFVRALDDLLAAARSHDLEAAPLAYNSLTSSCVQCHRYVARARVAR